MNVTTTTKTINCKNNLFYRSAGCLRLDRNACKNTWSCTSGSRSRKQQVLDYYFFINLSLGQNPFWRLLEVIAANNSVAALQAALDSHTTPDVVTQYLHVVLNYL